MPGRPAGPPAWSDVRDWFLRDCRRQDILGGGLHDLYVLDTGRADWDGLLAGLGRAPDWDVRFFRGGCPEVLPASFEAAAGGGAILEVDRHGLELRSFLFREDEIEFSLDTDRIADEPAYDRLLRFMGWLAAVTGRPALLTSENQREHVVAIVDPPRRGPP